MQGRGQKGGIIFSDSPPPPKKTMIQVQYLSKTELSECTVLLILIYYILYKEPTRCNFGSIVY